MLQLPDRPSINACCKVPTNLAVAETREGGITIYKCSVCTRRHHHLKAEPGALGVILKALGRKQ